MKMEYRGGILRWRKSSPKVGKVAQGIVQVTFLLSPLSSGSRGPGGWMPRCPSKLKIQTNSCKYKNKGRKLTQE